MLDAAATVAEAFGVRIDTMTDTMLYINFMASRARAELDRREAARKARAAR